tara:strand:+ start:1094 stop:1798 length:705 start_codon:yes stop_codon:yes gene_type:complete
MKKSHTFKEFHSITFPYDSPFDRNDLGLITNFIKFLSLRVAYVLYRIGITANMLNIFGLFLVFFGLIFLYHAISSIDLIFFILGYSCIAFAIFIDFIDGPLSKINKYIFSVGSNLDDLGPDLILIGGMLILGLISQDPYFFILISMNSIFYLTYSAGTLDSIKKANKKKFLLLFRSRYSLFSMRIFCSGILPSMCLVYINNPIIGVLFAKILISIYTLLSITWLRYSFKDRSLR